MDNLKMEMKGKILHIEIDISKRGKTSGSGKSVIVATTGGNVAVPGSDELKIGINCYTPVK